jgi:hypothetical protein
MFVGVVVFEKNRFEAKVDGHVRAAMTEEEIIILSVDH